MILGAEIGLLVFGVIALATGKLTLSKTRVVRGWAARLLGVIALLPLPLSFMIGITYGVVLAAQGRDVTADSVRWTMTGIEAGVLVLCAAAIYAIGWRLAGPAEAAPAAASAVP